MPGGGLLKHVLGYLITAAGGVCLVIFTPFSVLSGMMEVVAFFAILGIVLLAVGSYLIRHS